MPRKKTKLRPADYRQIEEAAALGCSQRRAAHVVGVSESLLKRRLKDDPKAAEAWARGLGRLEEELVGYLRQQAKRYTPATLALLSKINPERWGTTKEERKRALNVLVLPGALTSEEYQRRLEAVERRELADVVEGEVEEEEVEQ